MVTGAARKGALRLPPRIVLGGFDELTPQQSALLDALETAGCPHEQAHGDPAPRPAIARTEHLDAADELRAAARWSRDRLAENGRARVGVVIPALQARRALAERIFTEVLHPDWIAGISGGRPLFHVSAGRPLDSWPAVHAAFACFR